MTTSKADKKAQRNAKYKLPRPARARLPQDLESEFDNLLETMQATKSKHAVKVAFEASPTRLSRAAVKHAAKKQ